MLTKAPRQATHDVISIHKKHQLLLDTSRCDNMHVIADVLFCQMHAWVQAGLSVPSSHLVM